MEASFNSCATHAAHSQSHANFLLSLLSNSGLSQAGAQELPSNLLPVLAGSSPGRREKGSTTKGPEAQAPFAVTAIQSKHHR